MKCPKCTDDMEKGYLQTGNIIAFNKHKHKISLNPKDPGDIMISKKMFTGNNFEGYICKQCGIVVFEISNNDLIDESHPL